MRMEATFSLSGSSQMGRAGTSGPSKALSDSYHRPINSLRISINRDCNLSCFYCHNEGNCNGKRLMTVDEIEWISNIASNMGIRKVKLTGGEPLVRDDVVEIVSRISPYFDEVSLTTNAIRLAPIATDLRDAGLARVNISLNSLRTDRYSRITGSDRLDEVISGIDHAIDADLTPLKLNMVLLKGINDDEVPQMMEFAAARGAVLQLIELEMEKEVLSNDIYSFYHGDLIATREWIKSIGSRNGFNPLHNRDRFIVKRIPGGPELAAPVEVEFVMPMHNSKFCRNCTRIRLTAGGYLKGCLFDRDLVKDVLGAYRNGASVLDAEDLIHDVINERRPYWTDLD